MYRLENMEHGPSMENMLTGSSDCFIVSESRQKVCTSRVLLVMHSEFLKKCLESLPKGHCECDVMLPDAPHNIVEKLVEVLSAGEICGTRAELNDVVELAMFLQIRRSEAWKHFIIKVERGDMNWHRRAVLSALRLSNNPEMYYLSTSGFSTYREPEISMAPPISSMAYKQHQQSRNETFACPLAPWVQQRPCFISLKLRNPEHINTIQKIWKSSSDCFFVTESRQKVYTSRLLLAINSEVLKECLETRPEGTGPYDIMLPEAAHNIVEKLVEMLSSGKVCGTKSELKDVVELAKLLQITDTGNRVWTYSVK